jgi:hypothetical protein
VVLVFRTQAQLAVATIADLGVVLTDVPSEPFYTGEAKAVHLQYAVWLGGKVGHAKALPTMIKAVQESNFSGCHTQVARGVVGNDPKNGLSVRRCD